MQCSENTYIMGEWTAGPQSPLHAPESPAAQVPSIQAELHRDRRKPTRERSCVTVRPAWPFYVLPHR